MLLQFPQRYGNGLHIVQPSAEPQPGVVQQLHRLGGEPEHPLQAGDRFLSCIDHPDAALLFFAGPRGYQRDIIPGFR